MATEADGGNGNSHSGLFASQFASPVRNRIMLPLGSRYDPKGQLYLDGSGKLLTASSSTYCTVSTASSACGCDDDQHHEVCD